MNETIDNLNTFSTANTYLAAALLVNGYKPLTQVVVPANGYNQVFIIYKDKNKLPDSVLVDRKLNCSIDEFTRAHREIMTNILKLRKGNNHEQRFQAATKKRD